MFWWWTPLFITLPGSSSLTTVLRFIPCWKLVNYGNNWGREYHFNSIESSMYWKIYLSLILSLKHFWFWCSELPGWQPEVWGDSRICPCRCWSCRLWCHCWPGCWWWWGAGRWWRSRAGWWWTRCWTRCQSWLAGSFCVSLSWYHWQLCCFQCDF